MRNEAIKGRDKGSWRLLRLLRFTPLNPLADGLPSVAFNRVNLALNT